MPPRIILKWAAKVLVRKGVPYIPLKKSLLHETGLFKGKEIEVTVTSKKNRIVITAKY